MRLSVQRLVLAVAVVAALGVVLYFLISATAGSHVIHFSPTP